MRAGKILKKAKKEFRLFYGVNALKRL